MEHIFISYSHKDSAYAHELAACLEDNGLTVWADSRLDYGDQWPHVLQNQLDSCAAFIVIMSSNSYESQWVQNELSRAKRKNKKVYPLLLQGEGPWLSVEAIQYVDVRTQELPPRQFIERIKKELNKSHEKSKEINSYVENFYTDEIEETKLTSAEIAQALQAIKDADYSNLKPLDEGDTFHSYLIKELKNHVIQERNKGETDISIWQTLAEAGHKFEVIFEAFIRASPKIILRKLEEIDSLDVSNLKPLDEDGTFHSHMYKELRDFILQERNKGETDISIWQTLAGAGHKDDVIETAFIRARQYKYW